MFWKKYYIQNFWMKKLFKEFLEISITICCNNNYNHNCLNLIFIGIASGRPITSPKPPHLNYQTFHSFSGKFSYMSRES